ncbi:MAG TPA: T9SS type A sorting domain-containing protein, partial [Chitinophagaceae bacterium]|nr:T9SS type A sorting domain-containing protein [Chitinophagaceae bacterium]
LHFFIIGKIIGRGNAYTPQQYRFVDRQPLSGTNYYRLKQVDINGNFNYSVTKRLDFKSKETVNQLYPTMATNNINIRLANADDVACYIINSAGALVQQIKPPGFSFTVQVQSLARGVYIFSIINSKGEKDNLNFVKQ